VSTITNLRVYTPPGSRERVSPDPSLTPDGFNTRLLRMFLAHGYCCDLEPIALDGTDAEAPGYTVTINEHNTRGREIEVLVFSTEAAALTAIDGAVAAPQNPAAPADVPQQARKAFTAVYNRRGDGDYDFIMAVANDHFLNSEGNQSIAERMADDLRQSGEEILLLQLDRLDEAVDVWSPKGNKETNAVEADQSHSPVHA